MNGHQIIPPPSNHGLPPGACALVIRDYENTGAPPGYPPDVGYSSIPNGEGGITYTVDVQLPSGVVYGVKKVIPSVPRPPYPQLIKAFPLEQSIGGTSGVVKYVYPGFISAGRVHLMLAEQRYSKPCEGGV